MSSSTNKHLNKGGCMFNPNVVVKNIVTQTGADSFISLVARVLIAYIFLVAGWGKITGYAATAGGAESQADHRRAGAAEPRCGTEAFAI